MPTQRRYNFDDLDFNPVSPNSRVLKATLTFRNGFGCNIYMHSPNTNKWAPYEFELTYNGKPTAYSSISDENIGYCTKTDISEYLLAAQRIRR